MGLSLSATTVQRIVSGTFWLLGQHQLALRGDSELWDGSTEASINPSVSIRRRLITSNSQGPRRDYFDKYAPPH